MDGNDRQAIEGLFQKLAEVEGRSAPRDAESEAFIRQQVGRQPAAPYYMAQTIVMQEQALNAAQARIEELEREGSEPRSTGGGLLGSLFGGGSRVRGAVPGTWPGTGSRAYELAAAQPQSASPSPWQNQGRGMGGGFLAGAAQTAMGVAGGVLLGNAIAGMFGAEEAHAAPEGGSGGGAGDQPDNDAGNSADSGGDDGFDSVGDFGDMDV